MGVGEVGLVGGLFTTLISSKLQILYFRLSGWWLWIDFFCKKNGRSRICISVSQKTKN